jgi:hypothetical protein
MNFIEILERAPIKLAIRVNELINTPQRAKFHPEGDVLQHTMIVTNRLAKIGNIDLTVAGFFHDIGKDETTVWNPTKSVWTAPGHELVSAKLCIEYADFITSLGANPESVREIVFYHMRIKQYISGDMKKEAKRNAMESLASFQNLLYFSKADKMVDEDMNPYLTVDEFTFN